MSASRDDVAGPPEAAPAEPPAPEGPLHLLDDLPPGPWPARRAFEFCEQLARAHYENFPVASRFLRAELRPHVCALYAFARVADDFADEPAYAGRRGEALDRWDDELHRCFHDEASHPVFVALAETVARFEIPITPLLDLLSAFRMDLTVRRYATFVELRRYSDRSANPVGRLVLAVFGHRDPALHPFSDELCTALQLANFWQDVALDLARDRIYLPQEDLRHFGVDEEALLARRPTPQFRDLMRFEVARTRALFERARPLGDRVRRDFGFELRLIWSRGMAVLDRIEQVRYDVFARRQTLGLRGKAAALLRAAAWSARLSLSR